MKFYENRKRTFYMYIFVFKKKKYNNKKQLIKNTLYVNHAN